MLDLAGSSLYTVSVWTSGKIEIEFKGLQNCSPFDQDSKRLELLEMLNRIPGLNIPASGVSKYPNFNISILQPEGSLESFLGALDWTIAQARQENRGS
jgi:hypothetical protein